MHFLSWLNSPAFLLLFWGGLFCLGALFGSFSTVLIRRTKHKQTGIIDGKSECPQCKHPLGWYELIPLFSFLFQLGKCRHCKKTIPSSYFWTELTMASVFCLMGYIALSWGFFIDDIRFWVLILFGFITVVYTIYDIMYQEIPDNIMVFGYVCIFILFILQAFFPVIEWIPDAIFYTTTWSYIIDHLFAAVVLYSFFFLQILIPGTLFLWKQGRKSEIGELFLLYFIFPFTVLIDTLKPKTDATKEKADQDEDDIPMWIGAGDLLVALFIGLTLGIVHGIVAFFFAYVIGSIIGIMLLMFRPKQAQENNHMIAFGPFLAIGWILALLFYVPIIENITHFL